MSDIETNKQLVRRFMGAFSSCDIDLWASMLADDATWEIMGNCVMSGLRNKAEIVEATRGFVKVFPEGIQINDPKFTAEGNRVAMEYRGGATSVTGAPYNNTYHLLFVIRDGKIKEGREYACTKLVDQVLEQIQGALS